MPPPLTTILLTLLFLLHSSATTTTTTRRLLHHPFFPLPSQPPSSSPLSPSPSPSTSHNTLPKLPFSSTTTTTPPTTTTTTGNPFFPTLTSPPPPLSTSLPTFPANISSLALPTSHSPPSHSSPSPKLTITLILLSFLTISLISSLFIILRRKHRRHHHPISDSTSLYPPNLPPSDTSTTTTKLPTTSKTSSEFLYLGTIATTSSEQPPLATTNDIIHHVVECELQDHDHQLEHSEIYLKLCGTGSPELKPLPPLPKQSFHSHSFDDSKPADDEEFYSPTASSSVNNAANDHKSYFYCYNSSYLTSPEKSPENSHIGSPAESDVSVEIRELAAAPAPPPPPPPPMPARSWGSSVSGPIAGRSWASSGSGLGVGPPPLIPPSGPVGLHRSGALKDGSNGERVEEGYGKTKLKALHWDKVRASSDRVMVWDQLKPGSFQLNEEMIETLFKANGPTTMGGKDGARRSIMPLLNEETRVLDPKKSQNVAILLKALNVTEDEVCEALLEGNADTLGTELLESLNKMAPTKEEERNLKEYKDESPLKLGPAEKFLKAVLNVPFAFKRVDAMLYMATFDSEVEYLRKSFETLEAACGELRNSRMFLRLLEAVLKTGNRMNDGTNRGDAQAFKLDTLLKLVDIKGTDGKTTLLHFVVQEIIKAEGSRLSQTNQDPTPSKTHDIDLRKQGLEVVAGLGGELTNVKKAAAMDSDSLSADIAKLARGIMKVNEVLQLNEGTERTETNKRFSESVNAFLKKAEMEIIRMQSQESSAFSRVKELTEYFHGNLAKEEAHPLRIFMVVRDFLGVLDQVCKEVGKINDRTTISSVRPFPVSVNPTVPPPFPVFTGTQRTSSSDDESIVLV